MRMRRVGGGGRGAGEHYAPILCQKYSGKIKANSGNIRGKFG